MGDAVHCVVSESGPAGEGRVAWSELAGAVADVLAGEDLDVVFDDEHAPAGGRLADGVFPAALCAAPGRLEDGQARSKAGEHLAAAACFAAAARRAAAEDDTALPTIGATVLVEQHGGAVRAATIADADDDSVDVIYDDDDTEEDGVPLARIAAVESEELERERCARLNECRALLAAGRPAAAASAATDAERAGAERGVARYLRSRARLDAGDAMGAFEDAKVACAERPQCADSRRQLRAAKERARERQASDRALAAGVLGMLRDSGVPGLLAG